MKHVITALLLTAIISNTASAQKKDEINFSDAFQVDSSELFMIPKLIDNDNIPAYGKGKGYLPWGEYSDVYFYNSKTNQTKKVFGTQLAIITSFTPRRYYSYYETEKTAVTPANILNNHVLYFARTENFNGDNALDSEDPIYLYISSKTGDNLRQITPKGYNVLTWIVSKDKKMILVKVQNDKNGNKKFGNGDDQSYMRIDLDDDVSKIKCYPIPM